MDDPLDPVARYAKGEGLVIRRRTVLVEGTSDEALFALAARLEAQETGFQLIGDDLAVTAAGDADHGGASGVARELMTLRAVSRRYLGPTGVPVYRFVALFDNDSAGKKAISNARELDSSLVEYKDLFRLVPIMPIAGSLDPADVRRTFERENAPYRQLDWEIEDLLPASLVKAFLDDNPSALRRVSGPTAGKVHRDFASDAKSRLHRFVRDNAMRSDLCEVIDVLKVLRHYLGLPSN